ncbi:response regulator transcription factor [Hydrocarboniphaga sp.]|uniref:response regulator transcription factor n=1 Tax=Hydrocarboniphaga sp. TaxID=2033016 RepID=UPI003D0F77D8
MIHIVDDDEAVRSSLSVLARSYGWHTRLFASAKAFLDALSDGDPSCLLLDLNMPGTNGAELMELLSQRQAAFPVIAITGQSQSSLVTRVLAAGARLVLHKPFPSEDLKSAVDNAIGRCPQDC